MSKGVFIKFNLPFKKDGAYVSSKKQAMHILTEALILIKKGTLGVAITYSANYGQTKSIEKVYGDNGWKTGVSGANQADVMYEMEKLLGSDFVQLQRKMHIAPITTMNGFTEPIDSFSKKHMGIVKQDLKCIKENYLEKGWDVFGWQNQDTLNN